MIYKVLLKEHAMEVDLFQDCSMVIEVFILFFETGPFFIVQAITKLTIVLLPTPVCWDHRCVTPCWQ